MKTPICINERNAAFLMKKNAATEQRKVPEVQYSTIEPNVDRRRIGRLIRRGRIVKNERTFAK